MDGLDDLPAVDALQVDRGDAEFGMAELALDGVEGHALVGELDGVGVAQLMGRERRTPASAASRRGCDRAAVLMRETP